MRSLVILVLSIMCIGWMQLQAQTVGIGTNNPRPSAVVDVSSTSKGILFPRMTTAQRNAIVSPADGLHIFNTNTYALEYFDSTFNIWVSYKISSNLFVDTIKVDTENYIVPAGYNLIRIVINSGVLVTGNVPISFDQVQNGAVAIIENYGRILGYAGEGGYGGGKGSSNSFETCLDLRPQGGKGGGSAISFNAGANIQLKVFNHGIIAGGGGGGGGGNFGLADLSSGGGGGGGQGSFGTGGEKGYAQIPFFNTTIGSWTCSRASSDATNGGNGTISGPGIYGTGNTGNRGGFRGGAGGAWGMAGEAGLGGGATGGPGGKAIRNNVGHNNIINIGVGVVYGVVD